MAEKQKIDDDVIDVLSAEDARLLGVELLFDTQHDGQAQQLELDTEDSWLSAILQTELRQHAKDEDPAEQQLDTAKDFEHEFLAGVTDDELAGCWFDELGANQISTKIALQLPADVKEVEISAEELTELGTGLYNFYGLFQNINGGDADLVSIIRIDRHTGQERVVFTIGQESAN